MIEIKRPQELSRLRRVALTAQGLSQTEPYGHGLVGARKAINHIGYVQIDSISVVERAHNHILHSRVPKFKATMTNQMLLDGDIFEYWTHAAAFLPIADFRFSLPYKHAIKSGQTHWYKNPDRKLMTELLARIRSDGPLRSRDLNTDAIKRSGWWDWKPAKKALEQMFMQGDLMVCDRTGFQKTYDLTERVLPSKVNSTMPSLEEFAEHIIDQQLACHGFATLKGMTYLRRNAGLRKAVKCLVDDKLAQGSLEQIRLSNGDIFIAQTGVLERTLPRISNRMLILSPFDNSVIQRERLKSLFDYHYQLECYVPAAKRKYGYFSLPLLFRGEFIGRMDCKVHRKANHLEIKSIHFQYAFEQYNFDEEQIVTAFIKAIVKFRDFQNCNSISLLKVRPQKLYQRLCSAIKPLG